MLLMRGSNTLACCLQYVVFFSIMSLPIFFAFGYFRATRMDKKSWYGAVPVRTVVVDAWRP